MITKPLKPTGSLSVSDLCSLFTSAAEFCDMANVPLQLKSYLFCLCFYVADI